MNVGLNKRVAFVAGASSGLGRESAVALAREGAQVAICSRNRSRIDRAAQYIQKQAEVEADQVLPIVCDVTEEAHIAKAMLDTVSEFGGLNVLVTNAGGPPAGKASDFDSKAWQKALELNFMSTVNLCRHALPHLQEAAAEEQALARIIMITSISAKQPIPNLALSNSARAGVQGFAKSLSEEVGPEGITVNTVLPGYTRTARLKDLAGTQQEETGQTVEEIEAGWAKDNALKRIGTPKEFAAAVTFLASQQAGYITGVALPVDGGRSKGLL